MGSRSRGPFGKLHIYLVSASVVSLGLWHSWSHNKPGKTLILQGIKNTFVLKSSYLRSTKIFFWTLPFTGMRIYSSVSSISHNILDLFKLTDKSSAFRSEVQLKTTLMQRMVFVMGGKNRDYPGYWKNLLHPAVKFLMKSKGKAEAFSDYKLAWQQ